MHVEDQTAGVQEACEVSSVLVDKKSHTVAGWAEERQHPWAMGIELRLILGALARRQPSRSVSPIVVPAVPQQPSRDTCPRELQLLRASESGREQFEKRQET
ncbi:hypothetical protein O9K51_07911 [Purpureocillium lavendulum]|uniref:Uncharacterized protein n=1 Tax=Purpureocillium lavendulum TaxID=1247861 RepID=A0AB34FLG5_9HYPO|nr:hypothetical protein O9K51_07911 [Purpureocillium lavendulum]